MRMETILNKNLAITLTLAFLLVSNNTFAQIDKSDPDVTLVSSANQSEIIDSVVVHELVHTKIKNHSKKFWSNVYRIIPEYPEYNKWLKQNGNLLNLD